MERGQGFWWTTDQPVLWPALPVAFLSCEITNILIYKTIICAHTHVSEQINTQFKRSLFSLAWIFVNNFLPDLPVSGLFLVPSNIHSAPRLVFLKQLLKNPSVTPTLCGIKSKLLGFGIPRSANSVPCLHFQASPNIPQFMRSRVIIK